MRSRPSRSPDAPNCGRGVFNRYGDLGESDNLTRCLTAMSAIKGVAALEADFEALRSEFSGGSASYPRLIRLFHEQIATRRGESRWGDQSKFIER